MSDISIVLSLRSGQHCVITPFRDYEAAWEWLLSDEAAEIPYVLCEIKGHEGKES